MTFTELRQLAQKLYKEAVDERNTFNQTAAEMTGIYAPEYILSVKEKLDAEFTENMKERANTFREATKALIAEKRKEVDNMIITPPSAEQVELLNAVKLRGSNVSKAEYQLIAQQISSNYQALNMLISIGAGFGVRVDTPAEHDFQTKAAKLDWAETYLAERARGLENFKTARQAHAFDRLFFGEGWQDNFYQSNLVEVFD